MKNIIIAVLVLVSITSTVNAADLSIPTARRITWQGNVGIPGGIPTDYTNCATAACNSLLAAETGSDITTLLQTAINSVTAGQKTIVNIPVGSFTMSTVSMIKHQTIIRGAGMNSTTIQLNAGGNYINISGGGSQEFGPASGTLVSGYTKDSTSVVVSSSAGLQVGDLIMFTQVMEWCSR